MNDQNKAENISNWIGTKDAFTLTAQLHVVQKEAGLGSVRINKEFLVHPDSIKQGLSVGEAYLVSKVGGFRCFRNQSCFCRYFKFKRRARQLEVSVILSFCRI